MSDERSWYRDPITFVAASNWRRVLERKTRNAEQSLAAESRRGPAVW
jgi:hypothetical protein